MIAGISRLADLGTPKLYQGSKLAESSLHHQAWALKKPWKNFALAIPL